MGFGDLDRMFKKASNRFKKRSGRVGSWRARHTITEDPRGEPIVLIPGEYLDPWDEQGVYVPDPAKRDKIPYYIYRSHSFQTTYNGKQTWRRFVCSAGYDDQDPKPCFGCYLMMQGERWIKRDERYVFNAFVLKWYHRVPATDQTGAPVLDGEGKQITTLEPCTGRGCPYCSAGLERVFGRQVYLEMGSGFFADLQAIYYSLKLTCNSCGAALQVAGYKCPSCGSVELDLRRLQLDEETAAAAVQKPRKCSHCGQEVKLEPFYECERGCENPQPTPLFWRVLYLRRQGQGQGRTILSMVRNEDIDKVPPPRGYNSLREYITERVKPFDFEQMLVAPDLQRQSEILGRPLPPELIETYGKPYDDEMPF